MDKRERFEIEYADQNNMRPEDFVQYRMGDTYRLPAIARAYRYFCWGWDAAESEYCEEMPEPEPMTEAEFLALPPMLQQCYRTSESAAMFGNHAEAPKMFSGLAPKTDT